MEDNRLEIAQEYADRSFQIDTDTGYNAVKNDVAFHSYLDGMNYMIEKAEQWLKENAEGYVWWHNEEGGLDDNFLDDFYKAMKA